MTERTYECEICQSINSAAKLQCSTCGTIPARYSVIGRPAKIVDSPLDSFIPVVNAYGCQRATMRRTIKRAPVSLSFARYAEIYGADEN